MVVRALAIYVLNCPNVNGLEYALGTLRDSLGCRFLSNRLFQEMFLQRDRVRVLDLAFFRSSSPILGSISGHSKTCNRLVVVYDATIGDRSILNSRVVGNGRVSILGATFHCFLDLILGFFLSPSIGRVVNCNFCYIVGDRPLVFSSNRVFTRVVRKGGPYISKNYLFTIFVEVHFF